MREKKKSVRIALLLALFTVPTLSYCGQPHGPGGADEPMETVTEAVVEVVPVPDVTGTEQAEQFPVPLKPLPKTITPCRACHGPEKDFKINWTREEVLRVHTNIRLKDGHQRLWCLDCHNPDERDFLLPLSSGKLIPFKDSYELCGKCHGPKYRDWRHGIHGKRTGFWNGKKAYLLCVQCHNPHAPKFKPMEPMPPPKKPRSPKVDDGNH